MTIIINFVGFLAIDGKFRPCYKIPSKIDFQNIQYYTIPFTDKPFFNVSSVVFNDLTLSDIFYVREARSIFGDIKKLAILIFCVTPKNQVLHELTSYFLEKLKKYQLQTHFTDWK